MESALTELIEEEDEYLTQLGKIWNDEMRNVEREAIKNYFSRFMNRFYMEEDHYQMFKSWGMGREMDINKKLIKEYAEAVVYADRASDPVVYHYLRKRIDSLYDSMEPIDIERLNLLLKESQQPHEISQHQYVIDTLKKDIYYMNSIFTSKEEYVAFITAWKAINKTLRYEKVVGSVAYTYDKYGVDTKKYIMKSALDTAHHIVYLMATGKIATAIKVLNPDTRAIIIQRGFFENALNTFKDVLTPAQRNDILLRIHEWTKSKALSYWG
jgi:hypothetical protein